MSQFRLHPSYCGNIQGVTLSNQTFPDYFQAKVNSETSEALDDLDNETRKWVASLGSSATKISQIVSTKDPAVSIKLIKKQYKLSNN